MSGFQAMQREIIDAVEKYAQGILQCDVGHLDSVFDTNLSTLKSVAAGADGVEAIKTETYEEARARWSAGTPQAGLGKVLAIDVVHDKLAIVKVDLTVGAKHFLDVLLFLKVNDGWVIANKMFVVL